MHTFRILPAALALLLPCSANASTPEQEPVINATAQPSQDAFALGMFRSIVAEQAGNVVFSPASLENVLDLLKEGARGATLAELSQLPAGQKGVKSAMQVESADALFVADDPKLKPVKVSDITRVSFLKPDAAAKTVNTWCKKKTHGLIPSIVSPGDFTGDTRMVLANAVYLKEKWLHPFNADETVDNAVFRTPGNGRATVSMMNRKGEYRYAEGADWQAVALFYATQGRAGEPGCFIGILPKGDAREFAATLTPEKYGAIRAALAQSVPAEVKVSLPKMKVETEAFSLNKPLMANGLKTMFSPVADFTGFADERLAVSSVLQRCYVEVDEEKTEAAAVTAVIMQNCCVMVESKSIRFDRPFIWAIDDLTTGSAPFFMGLYEQP